MRRSWLVCAICAGFACRAWADGPQTQPSDPAMQFILSQASTVPSPADQEGPTTQPVVLQNENGRGEEARDGEVVLSNGRTVKGKLSTTLGQPIRVWDAEHGQYQDVPFSLIQRIEVRVIYEREEPEWKFQASGSDVKEYSGKSYPARQTEYTFTLLDGTTFSGPVAAPLYLDGADGRKIYILHKDDKGQVGQGLADLVYVKTVRFGP